MGISTQPDTIHHEAHTEVEEATPPNTDQVVGINQNRSPSTSEQRTLNQTLSVEDEDRLRNVFLGSLVWSQFQQQQARGRQIFRPLPRRPVVRRLISVVQNIQVQTPPVQNPLFQNPPMANIANPKVKFAQLQGKRKEDPDAHVAQFDTKWEASGFDVIYNDDVKKQQFVASLEGKAMNWYKQYGATHFAIALAL